MAFADKSLQCSDCGIDSTFNAAGSHRTIRTLTVAAGTDTRCFQQSMLNLTKKLRYRFNPVTIGRFTAGTAVAK